MIEHKQPAIPNSLQRLQIAAAAMVHPKTVLKAYQGKPVRSSVAARVLQAARTLHFTEPRIVIATW